MIGFIVKKPSGCLLEKWRSGATLSEECCRRFQEDGTTDSAPETNMEFIKTPWQARRQAMLPAVSPEAARFPVKVRSHHHSKRSATHAVRPQPGHTSLTSWSHQDRAHAMHLSRWHLNLCILAEGTKAKCQMQISGCTGETPCSAAISFRDSGYSTLADLERVRNDP
jgi:hypothetical protein